MNTKLRVLVFTGCYLPGFRAGGPIRSLVNLVTTLGPRIDFRIITLDRDVGSDVPYADIRLGEWQSVGGIDVLYLSRSAASMRRLAREVASLSPHVIYLNGFFEPVLTLRVLLARRLGLMGGVPVLLAPRGDCSPGALAQKHLKKAIFIRGARLIGLHRNLAWHASNETEARDILRTIRGAEAAAVHVAPVLTADVAVTPAAPRAPGVLRVCFLSRIAPMKNLDFALRVLSQVRTPVEFTVYGPREVPWYWAQCEALIAALPANVRVRVAGAVDPGDVRKTLAEHDLLFLPSRGESFGHVIHEALSAGVPVLTSDRTPWVDLAAHGAGWSLPLDDPDGFRRTMEDAGTALVRDRDAFHQRAIAYAQVRADVSASRQKTFDLFQKLSAR